MSARRRMRRKSGKRCRRHPSPARQTSGKPAGSGGPERIDLDRSELEAILERARTAALSQADEVYYGGAAGGGKSDLLLGLAITAHQHSIIFRRELTQLSGPAGLVERSRAIIGTHGRYNGLEHAWRDLPGGRAVEFGACQYDRDKHKYQGRPHDFIGFGSHA